MTVKELSRKRLTDLKRDYYCDVVLEHEGASWGDLAMIDELVSDEEVFEYFKDCTFFDKEQED